MSLRIHHARRVASALLLGTTLAAGGRAGAAVTLTIGAGSAVNTVDRSVTFDAVVTGTDLTNYVENGVGVTVPNTAGVFTSGNFPSPAGVGFSGGFHYPDGGANAPTVIAENAGTVMYGVEFSLGDGYFSTDTIASLHYEAFLAGAPVGAGTIDLLKGATIGFADPLGGGFDALRVGSYETAAIAGNNPFGTNALNALALDNVRVDLTPIPEPTTLAALAGVGAVALRRRR